MDATLVLAYDILSNMTHNTNTLVSVLQALEQRPQSAYTSAKELIISGRDTASLHTEPACWIYVN